MSYKIIGKYIKNLNFSIPNPKTFFLLTKNIANYKINIDIRSNQVKENIFEVLTTLNLSTAKDVFEKINTKIEYATLIELSNKNIEKNEMEKIVLIDVPSKIYGELRKIFVSLFENSGFKDIKISENVDFESLYKRKKLNKNFFLILFLKTLGVI